MAEPNSEATSIKDPTSTIPPEMIPLLAEIEASTEAGKFITLTFLLRNESKPTVSTEQSSPGSHPMRDVTENRSFTALQNHESKGKRWRFTSGRAKSSSTWAIRFRKYTKVVQLVVGPTFGYPESVLGEDNSHSLHPLKKVDDENMSDSDDLTDYVDTVREGIESKEEGAEDGGGEDESEITGMEEDDLTQEGENNTTDQQPEEDKKD
ncbi:hypothetical protein BSL78_21115 [Apostichopus japonicus]|uniref:Uncharacterized protein n=1 Tax=Stichopus japonicus TaxID=307972 RepID=A0A2G8K224_STIJA|nr:hypothetical protein BSL78_21115 [Apostichopus japonicus]